MIRIACSDSEASCLIASLITEIAMPCPCEGGPLRICGTGPDGAPNCAWCASTCKRLH